MSQIRALESFLGAPALRANTGRRLLILSYLPFVYSFKIEVLIGRALQEQGWSVAVLADASTYLLATGYHRRILGCDVLRIEDYVDFGRPRDLQEQLTHAMSLVASDLPRFKNYYYRGAPLGLHALATLSAMRPDGALPAEGGSTNVLRRLLRRSILLYEAADQLYSELKPSLALGMEKGFVTTCETFYAAINNGVSYVQWFNCHEPNSMMLKRYRRGNERDHPFSISQSNWERVRNTPWRDEYLEAVLAEFERGYRTGAWFRYKSLSAQKEFPKRAALQARLGLDAGKKTAVIYSHILNDANLFYGTDLFPGGYEEWLVETVRAAADNRAVNWVLKLHPANVVRNARVGYAGEYGELIALRRAFGEVPSFLRVVSPAEEVSPLSFFALTDWGITVRGTVGLELPCFGVPVITAGSGRYSDKGFTVDSATKEDYLAKIRAIDRIPPLTPDQRRLGVLYAFHVFKVRPARYGGIFEDRYPMPQAHPRHRDVELKVPSVRELFTHPQMQAIVRFLGSPSEDDFFEAINA